jgi:predicted small lipoprotein YifL
MMQNNNASARRVQIAGLVLMLMVAVMLAGCGKKGNPEAPPGVPNTYPSAYPKQ